jgi:hypothetical protein
MRVESKIMAAWGCALLGLKMTCIVVEDIRLFIILRFAKARSGARRPGLIWVNPRNARI